jgi:hypothetical protein
VKKGLLGISCVLLLVAAPVSAAPSINGSTGLIDIPSADVLREGEFSLGYYHLKDGGVGILNANVAPNLELGVAGFRYDRQDNKNYVNAKFSLAPETVFTPGLAIGIEDIGNTDKRSVYAVASKALPFGFRMHLGTGSGRYNGVFAGLEKTLNPVRVITGNNTFPATTLIAEYDGKHMNYGARMSITPGLKLDAGWRNHNGYVGMSYTY